ncbi:MAG: hypothetical protein IT342_23545 [Candidatus Melainabacteria bacterium]|nr:hypothetical protein [Candidatus Melainabacteria bacterium]
MSYENSPESAALRLTQAELQVGGQAGEQFGKQIAPEMLYNLTSAAGVQPEVAAEGTNQPFRPVGANIEKFLDNESIWSGLRKDDLNKIIKSAVMSKDTERSQVATFLRDHFDDICSLSAKGGDRISRDDLTLYLQMLKQSEKNVAAGKFSWQGQKDIHYQHENQAGMLLPTVGVIGGLYTGNKVFSAAGPVVALTSLMFGNPRTAVIGTAATFIATHVGGMYLGSKAGGRIDRGMQDSGVRRHFVDEAEPAMKRLLQT